MKTVGDAINDILLLKKDLEVIDSIYSKMCTNSEINTYMKDTFEISQCDISSIKIHFKKLIDDTESKLMNFEIDT